MEGCMKFSRSPVNGCFRLSIDLFGTGFWGLFLAPSKYMCRVLSDFEMIMPIMQKSMFLEMVECLEECLEWTSLPFLYEVSKTKVWGLWSNTQHS